LGAGGHAIESCSSQQRLLAAKASLQEASASFAYNPAIPGQHSYKENFTAIYSLLQGNLC